MKKRLVGVSIVLATLFVAAAAIYFYTYDYDDLSALWTPEQNHSTLLTNNQATRRPAGREAIEVPQQKDSERNARITTPDPVDLEIKHLNDAFARLAEELSPSVVNIYTKTTVQGPTPRQFRSQDEREFYEWFFPYEEFGPQESQSLGSGFIIDAEEGLIVTNSHVVNLNGNLADEVLVKFIDQAEQEGVPAEILGTDPSTDVAVLQLKNPDARNLVAAQLGQSADMRVGEWVLAIGNPFGHAHTVTQGIISALGRNLEEINRSAFIQTSASINPGNSGGPLFNLEGKVIGINTAIDPRAQGIGFAIPIDAAVKVIDQIIAHGEVRRGWIGVGIAELPESLAQQLGLKPKQGVLIQTVAPGQPAAQAGLRPHDVIVSINGQTVGSPRELANLVADVPPGEQLQAEIIRNGRRQQITIDVGRRPNQPQRPRQGR